MIFKDRRDAGKQLSLKLQYLKDENCVVVGLLRGGVVVAAEVAKALSLPLDVMIVKKVGAPENEELALGAVSEEGVGVFNDHLISLLGVSNEYLRKEVERQKERIRQAKKGYLKGHASIDFTGKVVVLVDDGIATGASMKVAIQAAKAKGVGRVVLAVPVAAADSLKVLSHEVDEVICLYAPTTFYAVGAFYKNFPQITDEEVEAIFRK